MYLYHVGNARLLAIDAYDSKITARQKRHGVGFTVTLALFCLTLSFATNSAFAMGGCSPVGKTSGATLPNIVLIVVDTLRADRLEAERAGVPLMPFVKELSRQSWTFTEAIAQATWTRPSMASLFTSLYAGVHNQQFGVTMQVVEGQDHTADVLPETIETMASWLKKAGYATLGVQANWNMEPAFGVAQGFDVYEMMGTEKNAADLSARSLELVRNVKPPFFLYVHYMDPHAPYAPPEQYQRMFGETPEITDEDREILADYATNYYADKVRWDLGLRDAPPPLQFSGNAKEHVRIMYDGEVRFADDEIGRLLTRLRKDNSDTVVVFTADHGEELWERGSIGHGRTVFQEGAHVPLIFSFPDKSSRTVEERVELIDILPTLAAYLGLPARETWQGRNLLEQKNGEERPVFTQTMTSVQETNVYLAGVLHGPWKMILDVRKDKAEIFDLDNDPGETAPLSCAKTEAGLREIFEAHNDMNRTHPHYAPPRGQQKLDQETVERLRSQGYF